MGFDIRQGSWVRKLKTKVTKYRNMAAEADPRQKFPADQHFTFSWPNPKINKIILPFPYGSCGHSQKFFKSPFFTNFFSL